MPVLSTTTVCFHLIQQPGCCRIERAKVTPENETPLGPGHAFSLTVHVDVSTERGGFPIAVVSTRLGTQGDLLTPAGWFPPSAEQPQQFVEQVVPQPTHPPSVSDGLPTLSTVLPWINLSKNRVRYHAGSDGHMTFSCAMMHAVSRVRNTQSRAQDVLSRQHGKGKQSPDVPDNSSTVHTLLNNNRTAPRCARDKNLHRTHCADQQLTHVDSAGKESEVTKAKLKTSRVATQHFS